MVRAKATRKSTYERMPTHRGPRARYAIIEQEAGNGVWGTQEIPNMTGRKVQNDRKSRMLKGLVHAYSEVRSSHSSDEVR